MCPTRDRQSDAAAAVARQEISGKLELECVSDRDITRPGRVLHVRYQQRTETRVDKEDCSYFEQLCRLKLAERCQLLRLKVVDEQG